ncbi:MAG: hypothetical protein V3S97_05230 [Candidatus Bathyarchaeia archaeon]
MSEMLAKASFHLHSIDVEFVRNSLEAAGIRQDRYSIEGRLNWLVKEIESSSFESLQTGLRWIVKNSPEDPDRLVV